MLERRLDLTGAALLAAAVLIACPAPPARAEGDTAGAAQSEKSPATPKSASPRSAAAPAGGLEKLIDELSAAADQSPNDFDLRFRLANAYHDAGSLHSALQQYNEAVRIDSLKSRVWVNRGVVLRDLGRQEDAEASFRRAVDIDPGDALAQVNLGDMLLTGRRYPEAIDAYRKAMQIDPAYPSVYYSLAISFAESGLYRDAARTWRRSAELSKARGTPADLANAERALENAKLMEDIVAEAEVELREREVKKRELEEGNAKAGEHPEG